MQEKRRPVRLWRSGAAGADFEFDALERVDTVEGLREKNVRGSSSPSRDAEKDVQRVDSVRGGSG